MKILLITFSDNADHQDITFGMFESLYVRKHTECDVWVMAIKTPKVSVINTSHTYLVNCPRRPGIEKDTFNLKELHSIIKWIKKEHFDVIFFESLHIWNLPIMVFCHKNTRVYQMIHDLIPHEGDKQAKAVHLMNKAVCKLADYIVLCNQKYISKVTKNYGVIPERVRFVDMWRRFPEYAQPKFTRRVLFFGRMNPYKGLDNLLEIIRKCPEIQFDVIGRVDQSVQETVDELKTLPNAYVNNDYVSDEEMSEAFVNSDWVILPYNSATQSGVVIDSYRYSRPCIAYNVGAITEQIEDGSSGYLIEAGNINAFIEKLQEAIDMGKDAYAQMTRKAYEFGMKKYAAEGATERFLELVRE